MPTRWWKRFANWPRTARSAPAADPATELGPLVNAEHLQFVSDWIEKSIDEGAQLVLDGRGVEVPGGEGGYFMGPTVFDHVTAGNELCLARSLRAGPVHQAGPRFRGRDVETINASEFANGASIFTQSGYHAREFSRRIDAGMVGINVGIPVPISAFPFCGHKQSFFGDLHVMGRDGVAFFTETKAVTSYWFDDRDKEGDKVSTWEGTITRT